jgi:arylformamidase
VTATIYDISLPVSPALVVWPGDRPFQIAQPQHLDRGDMATVSEFTMNAHTGTHVDAPCHFVPGGRGVDALDLQILVGPALVVDATGQDVLSAAVLQALPIPAGTRRVLFRTQNSVRQACGETTLDQHYVAIAEDGARWLVQQGVHLVGIDCLSVAPWDDVVSTHRILLQAGVIPVEGLKLSGIAPGTYQLVCLPLNISGADGAPARAILIGQTHSSLP